MNHPLFTKWFTEMLLPNIPKNSLIIMDNASYHNVLSENSDPTPNSKKEYIFCEENEVTRNFDEIVHYSKTNNEIKKKFPKNKIIIYSPSLKRSGKKLKKYDCVNGKDFLIKKNLNNGIVLLERKRP